MARGGPHPVLLASRPDAADAEAGALVDLLDDALAHGTEAITIDVDGRAVALTNLTKRYFPQGGPGAQSKGDLLRYYLAVAPVILPHLVERPVVLTRYPDGVGGKWFYVQRAPEQRPPWVATCTTSIKPPKELTFLRIENAATLAWVANLGAIELHPWYARCSAPTKPDFLVIDLDPTDGTRFEKVRSAALHVKEALDAWGLPSFIKTSGATGLHVFVPIERGPTQREVHGVARDLATAIASRHPRHFTTEYRIANRPRGTRAARLQPELRRATRSRASTPPARLPRRPCRRRSAGASCGRAPCHATSRWSRCRCACRSARIHGPVPSSSGRGRIYLRGGRG